MADLCRRTGVPWAGSAQTCSTWRARDWRVKAVQKRPRTRPVPGWSGTRRRRRTRRSTPGSGRLRACNRTARTRPCSVWIQRWAGRIYDCCLWSEGEIPEGMAFPDVVEHEGQVEALEDAALYFGLLVRHQFHHDCLVDAQGSSHSQLFLR